MADRGFPVRRMRRLRRTARLREAVADVRVDRRDLILPLFVTEHDQAQPVASMPGVEQLPVAGALEAMRRVAGDCGVRQFILFGVTPTARKSGDGRYAADPDNPVNRAIAAARDAGLDVVLYADTCLCEYTDHGHCGPIDASGAPDNDATLAVLGRVAAAQAAAGADVVAPSGMMDGQVAAIRAALDDAGHRQTAILAYSVKYASSFYGPFRDAGQGGIKAGGGDRATYQMDYRRRGEWRLELQADLAEGADMVMVKPAATCLDVVHQVRQAAAGVPLVAYHVSGEFAMLHAAAQRGWIDLEQAAVETTTAIKRAGADLIITYFAADLARWLAR